MLLLKAGVGFGQRQKAENAVALLKEKLAFRPRIQRNRRWLEVPARGLVTWDVVRVRLGEIIPAGVKLRTATIGPLFPGSWCWLFGGGRCSPPPTGTLIWRRTVRQNDSNLEKI